MEARKRSMFPQGAEAEGGEESGDYRLLPGMRGTADL